MVHIFSLLFHVLSLSLHWSMSQKQLQVGSRPEMGDDALEGGSLGRVLVPAVAHEVQVCADVAQRLAR